MAGPSKVTKNALPLHPALRFAPGALTTPPLRGSPLCTTAPFTLLKGRLSRLLGRASRIAGSILPSDSKRALISPNRYSAPRRVDRINRFAWVLSHKLSGDAIRPFQEAEWNRCGGERAAWMPRGVRAMDGPCTPAPEQRWNEGSRAQRDPDGGQDLWFFGATAKETRPAGRN